MSRNLIITADDYGMCRPVNQAIEECLEAGTVRATCAMMNMPECDFVASLRKKFTRCSVGIHWTLTQGRPVLQPSQVSTLVDDNGNFHSLEELRRLWLLKRVNRAQITHELKAQFQKFHALAEGPDFWNTHENIHVFPGLFSLFVAVGRELNIPAMRSHRRITVPRVGSPISHNLSHPLYWLKGLVIAHWSDQAESMGVRMPDGRLYTPGYNSKEKSWMIETIHRVNWSKVRKAVEIVVHPATIIDQKLFGSLTESRVAEYRALTDPSLLKKFHEEGVDLVRFESLSCN